jgi:ubiquinone/menaquinone biosynthesis C-methylase UbiE
VTKNSRILDNHWISALNKGKKGKRFSMKWYLDHVITKELLKSCVLQGNVLDIGCGTGHRSFIAYEQSKCNIVGIDGSMYAINYANKNFSRDMLKFVNSDVVSMPFLNNSFDNVYMLAVIEHISNTKFLLSEIERVIVPKGKLFLCVTENDYHSSPDHVHIFSKRLLYKTFNAYKIINSFVKNHIIFMTIEI